MYVHKEFIIELRDFSWYYDFTYDLLSMMKIIDNAYKRIVYVKYKHIFESNILKHESKTSII